MRVRREPPNRRAALDGQRDHAIGPHEAAVLQLEVP